MVAIVVAHSRNLVIGRDGDLPWRLPNDLRRFRELTLGQTVVMGRKTFESLPDAFRPLPGRTNLVLTRRAGFDAPGAQVHHTLESALDACGGSCFVIGGGAVYRQALPLADRVYATEVDAEVDGDAFFPSLPADEWRAVEESDRFVENDHAYAFRTYDRRR